MIMLNFSPRYLDIHAFADLGQEGFGNLPHVKLDINQIGHKLTPYLANVTPQKDVQYHIPKTHFILILSI